MLVLIGIIFPWLLFFLLGRTWEGVICLILQLTVLGWLPAAIWALVVLHRSRPHDRRRRKAAPPKAAPPKS